MEEEDAEKVIEVKLWEGGGIDRRCTQNSEAKSSDVSQPRVVVWRADVGWNGDFLMFNSSVFCLPQ